MGAWKVGDRVRRVGVRPPQFGEVVQILSTGDLVVHLASGWEIGAPVGEWERVAVLDALAAVVWARLRAWGRRAK